MRPLVSLSVPLRTASAPVVIQQRRRRTNASRRKTRCPALAYAPPEESIRYAFMFPTAAVVATSCQLVGIGGAAVFSPIFLLGFPLLGTAYPLPSPAASIASALLTEVFGFASGLSGYARRGLVDWSVSARFAALAVPAAFGGALCAQYVAADERVLRGVYAALMFSLSASLALALRSDEHDVPEGGIRCTHQKGSAATSVGATTFGGFLTGLLGVGVGECVLPQLVRGYGMALPLAAGTSVSVVVLTSAAAAIVQFSALANSQGGDVVAVVPWSLVQYTIPGVFLGGQLAPMIAARGVLSDKAVTAFAATLFASVGVAFAIKAAQG